MAQILIVDDDKLLREMLRTALELDGHDVVDVCDGLCRYQAIWSKTS